ncbi:hypothetical protein HanRHA438_Chr16g0747511 [Helianthus annuus]|nr:hypothetical protein HanIR_Chr16g0799411 [Helianthus annuus]KAJ0834776.1 hypothetical protein HanRHA438_Chr16g0747511 [Helianthus annuus]
MQTIHLRRRWKPLLYWCRRIHLIRHCHHRRNTSYYLVVLLVVNLYRCNHRRRFVNRSRNRSTSEPRVTSAVPIQKRYKFFKLINRHVSNSYIINKFRRRRRRR